MKESCNEIKQYELIYRATEDGDTQNILFQKCKNCPNLLWIMKDKTNNIFGCFNSLPIYNTNQYSKDMKCFLFSVSKNKKYSPNLGTQYNIYNCSSHVIEFGDSDVFEFSIGENFLTSNKINFKNGKIFNHQFEISNNNKTVSLSELEVFRVI